MTNCKEALVPSLPGPQEVPIIWCQVSIVPCIYGHQDELLFESHGTLNSQAPHDKIQLPGTPLRRNFGCEQSVLRRTPPSIIVHQEMLIQVSRSKSPFLRSPLDRL